MSIETNLNQSPYFDDFNEDKKFHRVLFRPGYAVQARELTQLQSILQNQIQRFANEVLVDGTVVTGCDLKPEKWSYVKLRDKDANNRVLLLTDFFSGGVIANSTVTGETTGVTAKLLSAVEGSEAADPNYLSVFVSYTNSGSNNTTKAFADNETLIFRNASSGSFIVAANTIESSATGFGLGATVTDGIVYHKGNFVQASSQSSVISKYSTTPTFRVGFETQESIIDSNQDSSLLDNSTGSTNFSAPGASRLKITPVLKTRTIGETGANGFFAIADIQNGNVVRKYDTIYGELGTELARRTYEESGNYALEPFRVNVDEHLKTTTNSGVYEVSEGGDRNKLVVEVDPSIGYVNGYRIELTNKVREDIDKATTTQVQDAVTVGQAFGNYVICQEVVGTWDFQGLREVALYDTAQQAISEKGLGAQSVEGSAIGTARIRGFQHHSGTSGTWDGQFRIYLFDIKMNSGKSFSEVRSIYEQNSATDSFADIVLTNGVAQIKDSAFNTLVFPISDGVKTLKDASNAVDTQYVFRTESSVTFATDSTATVSANSAHPGGTESMNDTGSLTTVDERNIIVVAKEEVSTNPMTGYVSSVSGNTVTGSGTAFTTQYRVGEFITIDTNAKERITAINSDTQIKIANTASYSGTLAHKKTFPAGYIFDLEANGTISSTSSQHQIDLQQANLASSFAASVYFNVLRSDAVQANKTVNKNKFVHINTGSHSESSTGPWSLGVSDAFELVAVYKGSNTGVTSSSTDVTKEFVLDSGQKDSFYDTSKLVKRATSTLDTTNCGLLVKFNYFGRDRSTGIGFLSVDSYPIDDTNTANTTAITTQEIPLYRSALTGVEYDLRDVVDFRPLKANTVEPKTTGTAAAAPTNPALSTSYDLDSDGAYFPTPDENFQADIQTYLPRKDRVVLKDDGSVRVIQGIPAQNPVLPAENTDGSEMTLAEIDVPVYPSLSPEAAQFYGRQDYIVSISKSDNRRYTMRDIRNLDRKLEITREQTDLNRHEIEALKRPVLRATDPITAVEPPKDSINPNPPTDGSENSSMLPPSTDDLGPMRPIPTLQDIDLSLQAGASNISSNNVLALGYTETASIQQEFATKSRPISSESARQFNGSMSIYPSEDRRNGISINDRSRDITPANLAAIKMIEAYKNAGKDYTGLAEASWSGLVGDDGYYAKAQRIVVRCRGLKPNTRGWARFDARDVSKYCRANFGYTNYAGRGSYYTGARLITNSKCDLYFTFYLPYSAASRFRREALRFRGFKHLLEVSDAQPPVAGGISSGKTGSTTRCGQFYYVYHSRTGPYKDYLRERTSDEGRLVNLTNGRPTSNILLNELEADSTTTAVSRSSVENEISDNLSQIFTVDEKDVDGVYATSVDLYFATKPAGSNNSVYVQIREVERGVPSSILVAESKSVLASAITTSTTGSVATGFDFDDPVFLKSGTTYSITVVSAEDEADFKVWCAVKNADDVSSGVPAYFAPNISSFYGSGNTKGGWNILPSESLKFKINRASFSGSTGTFILENKDLDFLNVSNIVSGADDEFLTGETVRGECVLTFANNDSVAVGNVLKSYIAQSGGSTANTLFANGTIRSVVTSGSGSVTVKIDSYGEFPTTASSNTNNVFLGDGTWIGNTSAFTANSSAVGEVAFYDGDFGRVRVNNSNGGFTSSEVIRGQLSGASATVDGVVNPRIDGLVFNTPFQQNTDTNIEFSIKATSVGGSLDSAWQGVNGDTTFEFDQTEKRIFSKSNSASKSLLVRGVISSSNDKVSPIVDLSTISVAAYRQNICSNSTNETATAGDACARYISEATNSSLVSGSERVTVFLDAYRPEGSTVDVYLRAKNENDPEDLSTKAFTKLVEDAISQSSYSKLGDKSELRKLSYLTSANTNGEGFLSNNDNLLRENSANNGVLAYRSSDGSIYHTINEYQVKLVFTRPENSGTAYTPEVRRIIVVPHKAPV